MNRRQEEADGVVHVGGRADELGLLQQRGHRLFDLVLRHRQRLQHRTHGLTDGRARHRLLRGKESANSNKSRDLRVSRYMYSPPSRAWQKTPTPPVAGNVRAPFS